MNPRTWRIGEWQWKHYIARFYTDRFKSNINKVKFTYLTDICISNKEVHLPENIPKKILLTFYNVSLYFNRRLPNCVAAFAFQRVFLFYIPVFTAHPRRGVPMSPLNMWTSLYDVSCSAPPPPQHRTFPPHPNIRHGTPGPAPFDSDIWRSSLETCSNLFTAPQQVIRILLEGFLVSKTS